MTWAERVLPHIGTRFIIARALWDIHQIAPLTPCPHPLYLDAHHL